MEDDLKISKVEYRSIHWLDLTQILKLNLGEQTKLKKYFQYHVPFLCKSSVGGKIVHSFNTHGHVSSNGSVWYRAVVNKLNNILNSVYIWPGRMFRYNCIIHVVFVL